jgi:hypothetical protein
MPEGAHTDACKGKGKGNFIISIKIQRNVAVVEQAVTNKSKQ